MKTTSITILFFILILNGCKKDPPIVKGFYDSLHFNREGGGQIEFTITPTGNTDKFNVVITRFGALDSTILITMDLNNNNRSDFAVLDGAMNNKIQINGVFKQSNLLAGTWAYIYLVYNKKETEVTNTELRNSILRFEELIRERIH